MRSYADTRWRRAPGVPRLGASSRVSPGGVEARRRGGAGRWTQGVPVPPAAARHRFEPRRSRSTTTTQRDLIPAAEHLMVTKSRL
jgi:hypothetical protein